MWIRVLVYGLGYLTCSPAARWAFLPESWVLLLICHSYQCWLNCVVVQNFCYQRGWLYCRLSCVEVFSLPIMEGLEEKRKPLVHLQPNRKPGVSCLPPQKPTGEAGAGEKGKRFYSVLHILGEWWTAVSKPFSLSHGRSPTVLSKAKQKPVSRVPAPL